MDFFRKQTVMSFCALFALLLSSLVIAAPADSVPATGLDLPSGLAAEQTLVVFNRPVMHFRANFLGAAPKARADRARVISEEMLRHDKALTVSMKAHPDGQLVMLEDQLAFVVTAGDVDPLLQETPESVAKEAARRLEQVVKEARESRNMEFLIKAVLSCAVATALLGGPLAGIRWLTNWLERVLFAHAGRKIETIRVGNMQLIEGQHFIPFLRRLLAAVRWLLIALLIYEWLSFVLSSFPYTRPWGERLNAYLWGIADLLLGDIVSAIPRLGIALTIFLIARGFIVFAGQFFERIAAAPTAPHWIRPETMPTTRRLFGVAVWLFAIAMAYPYLPGSQTEAFKGLSVLLGLMVSLGASSLVGQGAAGLILVYTRTVHVGEYIRIGDYEGTVIEMGMFTTRIQTGAGEQLSLPNSLITGTVTKNYSRAVDGPGHIVDTTLTIGYDTPWRQVEAMLIAAASRTSGILAWPSPRVLQTALSDYYVEYRLVTQALPDRPRAEVLALLHANIQDVFNEYGVQIMSPHYMADPAVAKIVHPNDWHPAPAKQTIVPPAA